MTTDSKSNMSSSLPLTLKSQEPQISAVTALQQTTASIRELVLPEQQPVPRVTVSINNDHNKDLLLQQQQQQQPLACSVSLAERLLGDVVVAAAVTACAAPFLTVVDKALVERAAGSKTLLASARASIAGIQNSPLNYLKSPTFLWMWATYAATYSTINALRTITEQQEYQALSTNDRRKVEQQKRTSTATLFMGTTLVNSSASMIKDRAYAKMFAQKAASAAVPKSSYLLWMARDCTVISSSFLLPGHVSQFLQNRGFLEQEQANKIAQIGTPLVAQLVAGPLHFVGLDCFNRPLSNGSMINNLLDRVQFLKGAYVEVVLARMLRILPGYGIAGVYNTSWRNQYRNYLIEQKIRTMMSMSAEITTTTTSTLPLRSRATSSASTTGDLVALIRSKTKTANNTTYQRSTTSTTPSC